MDDLRFFGKPIIKLISQFRLSIYSADINLEFGLVLKCGKVGKSDGVTLPDGQMMKEIEENRYKYIGIVELDIVKSQKMGEQECKRKLKLVLKSKLNGKNKIKT